MMSYVYTIGLTSGDNDVKMANCILGDLLPDLNQGFWTICGATWQYRMLQYRMFQRFLPSAWYNCLIIDLTLIIQNP